MNETPSGAEVFCQKGSIVSEDNVFFLHEEANNNMKNMMRNLNFKSIPQLNLIPKLLTDWASAEIKHSGVKFDLTYAHRRYNTFERTETRLFSAACPCYTIIIYFYNIISHLQKLEQSLQ